MKWGIQGECTLLRARLEAPLEPGQVLQKLSS